MQHPATVTEMVQTWRRLESVVQGQQQRLLQAIVESENMTTAEYHDDAQVLAPGGQAMLNAGLDKENAH